MSELFLFGLTIAGLCVSCVMQFGNVYCKGHVRRSYKRFASHCKYVFGNLLVLRYE